MLIKKLIKIVVNFVYLSNGTLTSVKSKKTNSLFSPYDDKECYKHDKGHDRQDNQ